MHPRYAHKAKHRFLYIYLSSEAYVPHSTFESTPLYSHHSWTHPRGPRPLVLRLVLSALSSLSSSLSSSPRPSEASGPLAEPSTRDSYIETIVTRVEVLHLAVHTEVNTDKWRLWNQLDAQCHMYLGPGSAATVWFGLGVKLLNCVN